MSAKSDQSAPDISGVFREQQAGSVRTYYDGPSDVHGDAQFRARYFTCKTNAGLAAGADFSVMFTVDRSASEVWPYFKDFNLWQNPHNHYYSGVIGDLEGQTFALGLNPRDLGPHRYQVVRVIPEYLIVIRQPPPQGEMQHHHLPGFGGVDGGFHVFTLNEYESKTVIVGLMEHASLMQSDKDESGVTTEQALRPWRDIKMVPDWLRKWRENFVPSLKELIYAR